jgi:predicted nucleic-acid-binding protein
MVAVDTNVVVRLLVADDATQYAAAREVFVAGPVWISKTVLLEAAWVLTSVYDLAEADVVTSFRQMLGLVNVEVEDSSAVGAAFELSGLGMEIADALHLSARPSGAVFATFDRAIGRKAEVAGLEGVKVLRG